MDQPCDKGLEFWDLRGERCGDWVSHYQSMIANLTYTVEPLQQPKCSESFWIGEYIKAPKGRHPQKGREALGALCHHTLTRHLAPLAVPVLHCIKPAGGRKAPACALWATSAYQEPTGGSLGSQAGGPDADCHCQLKTAPVSKGPRESLLWAKGEQPRPRKTESCCPTHVPVRKELRELFYTHRTTTRKF